MFTGPAGWRPDLFYLGGHTVDLRAFYQKIREIEKTIQDEYAVVISEPTPDGGIAGVTVEVTRASAARMVAEGRAHLASEEEAAAYRAKLAESARRAAQESEASRVQVTLISDADLKQLRDRIRPQKG